MTATFSCVQPNMLLEPSRKSPQKFCQKENCSSQFRKPTRISSCLFNTAMTCLQVYHRCISSKRLRMTLGKRHFLLMRCVRFIFLPRRCFAYFHIWTIALQQTYIFFFQNWSHVCVCAVLILPSSASSLSKYFL